MVGGLLFTYVAGTTTKIATYKDQVGTLNTNPVVLDYRGEANVWLDQTLTYKFVLSPQGDTDPPTKPIWTVDNISAAVTYASLTQQIIGMILYPRTAAEIAALVTPTNYAYPELNLLRYGADPTGAASSNAAMTSAIAVCGSTGGTIVAPPGVYLFTGNSLVIDLTSKVGIIIQGTGSQTSGAQPAVRFNFSGTGTGVLISMNSAYGCALRGIQVRHTSALFTGTYIKCTNTASSDPQYCGVYDCTFGDSAGAGTIHLDLDKCINFTAERCSFTRGNPSVTGRTASTYSNVIRFRDCQWFTNPAVPVQNPGEAWLFEGCSFEPLTSTAPGAVLCTSVTIPVNGITFEGCWFGDASSTAGTWIELQGGGLHFHGNTLTGNATGTTGIKLRQFVGAKIAGNTFAVLLTAIDFATATCYSTSVENNNFNTVTNNFANPANHAPGLIFNPNGLGGITPPTGHGTFATNGYSIDANGIIEQWGEVTLNTNVATAVVFPKQFPASCWNVTCSITSAPGNQSMTAASRTTSQFTLTVGGTVGANTVCWRARGN